MTIAIITEAGVRKVAPLVVVAQQAAAAAVLSRALGGGAPLPPPPGYLFTMGWSRAMTKNFGNTIR